MLFLHQFLNFDHKLNSKLNANLFKITPKKVDAMPISLQKGSGTKMHKCLGGTLNKVLSIIMEACI